MNLSCLGGCKRAPLVVADEHRDQIIALIGERLEDPDRFDGLRFHGWILAFIHEFAGGVLVAVCPDCRPRMLPTYAQDGPEFPAFLPRKAAV